MTDRNEDTIESGTNEFRPGPYLAKIVSHLDPAYMGMLEVRLLRPVGGTDDASQLHTVKYMTPFYGVTSVDYVNGDPDDYNNTQKSYGMWMVPPDVGTTVVVIFIDADPKRGYWIGCVPDEHMNFMVPGIAATKFTVDGSGRVPVAEYNKEANSQITNITKINKPKHPMTDVLTTQGLIKDDIRGITTSSARREVPSSVFGISTPGPVDKQSNAKKGKVGKGDNKINTFVSRLGGTTFVMDDGDDKFLRKTLASEGPPEYAAVEQGETGGNPTVPHNELFRIRTRTGHQILMHNSEDLIYIGNAKGTTWIELTSNGKIDIYAKDSISVYTEQDLNFTAKRDINFTAETGNINLNAKLNFNAYAAKDYEIWAGVDGKLMCGGSSNIKAAGNHVETAAQIHMNGPAAKVPATPAFVTGRRPAHEPWNGHENLNPASFMPEKTVATDPTAEPIEPTAPTYFEKYTTVTDTFEQVNPPEENT